MKPPASALLGLVALAATLAPASGQQSPAPLHDPSGRPNPQVQRDSIRGASLQPVLDSARAALGAPGATAAVLCADGTLWSGASGIGRPGAPASVRTAFELGSVTKTYTAALVLRLVAEGRLSLEDRLARWYPEIPGAEEITLERLLNHTHGLHDPVQEEDFVPSVLQDPSRVWTADDLLARMRDPYFAPGAGWRYSNTGFHLVERIVERVGSSPLSLLLRERLLEPLELEATWYGGVDSIGAPLAAAFIDVNEDGSPEPVSLVMPWTAFRTSAGAAGAVIATALDAARWVHALVTGGVLEEPEWRRMTAWVDRPDGNRYGLGLLRLEREEGPLLGHKGNSAGYSASVFHAPADGTTAAVLTNAHATDVTPAVVALVEAAGAGAFCRP